MIPPLIVREACDLGIEVIAITDHNASANVKAVIKAAKSAGLAVLPGMELQTREDVHMLCLFDTLEQLEVWQKVVDAALPPLENSIEHFGEQFMVDETGDFLDREPRLLLTSTNLTLEEAEEKVEALGGLAIPAHVNRQAFGLIPTLGLVPADTHFPALEISRHITPHNAPLQFPQIDGYTLIQNGDVHRLNEFLGTTAFYMEDASIAEIRLALAGESGRFTSITGEN